LLSLLVQPIDMDRSGVHRVRSQHGDAGILSIVVSRVSFHEKPRGVDAVPHFENVVDSEGMRDR
jgi:hypothetical protein